MAIIVSWEARDQGRRSVGGVHAGTPAAMCLNSAPLTAGEVAGSAGWTESHRRGRTGPLPFLLLLPFLLPGMRPVPALAHGEADWIMEDPAYVSAFGQHCCGPQDCERIPASFIREEGRDIHLLPTG